MTKKKKKEKLHHCTVMQATDCYNALKGHDIPYVEGVKDWRDCLLCLLSEILNELEWLREDLEELSKKDSNV